jgi:hypothetical protein
MLLRISLIVAVIAGLAALGISHVKVGGKIDELNQSLMTTSNSLETAKSDASAAKKDARQTRDQLKKASDELVTTKSGLADATRKYTEQEALAKKYTAQWEDVTKKYTEAERRLAQWAALPGITPDKVEQLQKDFRAAVTERDAFAEEKAILVRNNTKLNDELLKYRVPNHIVEMPGLKGKIVAVDPKWDFVILDIGAKQGAKQDGILLVSRSGKLVGKVQITTVEPDRSIANIMPEWKLGELAEGDQVLF